MREFKAAFTDSTAVCRPYSVKARSSELVNLLLSWSLRAR
ncbi:hypothetical protein BM51_0661 [Streptococcus pneumoniae]|nr:hypothetical protein BM50_2124 [Streptococcus pneumoniae]KGI30494.1 hypothetical protein BM48_2082 [Streptococcus pneumoniae]KGI31563.1 hypothetical protein BM51_0661 [Streptococcus pneumoniae]KGI35020.1 hypothetical protein X231_1334 [Streptococcus pneumoniae ECC_3510]